GFVPFTCVDMHNNDNQKSLHFLGQLIQEMAINLDQQLQTILLKEIWLAVVNFLKKKANSSKGETISQDLQIKPPTYFGIKVALRMKK
ncbi:7035_t:CDS:1, partial [Racocetra persica]